MLQTAQRSDVRQELDSLLEARGLSGLGNVKGEDRTAELKTTVKPHLW